MQIRDRCVLEIQNIWEILEVCVTGFGTKILVLIVEGLQIFTGVERFCFNLFFILPY